MSAGCPAWDKDKNLQMLEFAEMVKNIPVTSINGNTAYVYANKLVSEFVKIFDLNQVS
jgi:predicted transcriptional regulator